MIIEKEVNINLLRNRLGDYGRIEVAGKDLLPYVKKTAKIKIEVADC